MVKIKNFFKKQTNLIIDSEKIPFKELKKHVLKYPNNLPSYFSKIPSKFLDEKNRVINYKKSLKTCAGFINLFRRSLLFTSPYDIEIFIDDQKITGFVGGSSLEQFVEVEQTGWQFLNHIQSDYLVVLKFDFKFSVQCNKNMYISQPWWHMPQIEIIPGYYSSDYPLRLSLFIPIKKNQNHIFVKRHSPLCYFTFETDQQINIMWNNEMKPLRLDPGLDLSFSVLKDKILKTIIKN